MACFNEQPALTALLQGEVLRSGVQPAAEVSGDAVNLNEDIVLEAQQVLTLKAVD